MRIPDLSVRTHRNEHLLRSLTDLKKVAACNEHTRSWMSEDLRASTDSAQWMPRIQPYVSPAGCSAYLAMVHKLVPGGLDQVLVL